MKCEQCGAEFDKMDNQEVCPECGTTLQKAETKEVETVETVSEAAAQMEVAAKKPAGKNGKKLAIAGIAAVAVAAVGAFGLYKGLEKDPKQTVISAFENIVPEGQVYPSEEIFGWSALQEFLLNNNSESGMSLEVDQIAEEELAMAKNAGLRLDGKNDKTNGNYSFDLTMTYGAMDFMELNAYYGDDTLMMSIPQLWDKVFTLDVSDGFVARLQQSEMLAPMLEQSGVDLDALEAYIQEALAQSNQENQSQLFDVNDLYKRYQEGSKAQDDFKAALIVEKAEKKSWTVDGASKKCRGYNVTISKDAMIKFLRDSSDFFLNDETLREDFLKQMEMSVRASEIFGAGSYGAELPSASQMQEQTYEEMKEAVDQALTYLDKSLSDVQMQVYVDKKGRLAAMDAVTTVTSAENETESVVVTLHTELQGGTYLTQNYQGTLSLVPEGGGEDGPDSLNITFSKKGVSNAKQLTCDFMAEFKPGSDEESLIINYTGTYAKDGGDYHVALDMLYDGSSLANISVSGVVEQLEKGKSIHIMMDEIKVGVEEEPAYVVLSGEIYWRPMTGEVSPLEGTMFDVITATEEDWQGVLMEAYFGIMGVTDQLGTSLY